MLNLVLYSDQVIPRNVEIDVRLSELMKSKKIGNTIAYIPSGNEPDKRFYWQKKAYYDQYDLDLRWFYDLNDELTPQQISEFLSCSAIHLSGGQTFGFLQRLRSSGLFGPLRNWAMNGGILVGTSAGGILMTPTIAVDALFSGHRPEEVKNSEGLDLVPFEFFPHLNTNESYFSKLLEYSKYTRNPIIAINDGDGVIVSDGLFHCIGNPIWIFLGSERPVDEIRCLGIAVS